MSRRGVPCPLGPSEGPSKSKLAAMLEETGLCPRLRVYVWDLECIALRAGKLGSYMTLAAKHLLPCLSSVGWCPDEV